ncbi:MAG TPA: class I SAM-dependent methyltransferase [Xanthobacteraceae bacterium]|nr:class I SAM-dependent methyltransferase [Xanthobacteraceae bacterium]
MSYPAQTNPDQAAQPRPSSAASAGGLRGAARERTVAALRRLAGKQTAGAPFRLIPPDGTPIDFGQGEPVFTLRVRSPEGLDALASVDALNIAHAYMDEKLDFEGDLLEMLRYQEQLRDAHPSVYLWRRLHPILVGRPRVNPQWIALHYDAQNAQLHVSDHDWHTYTPGIYLTDDEELEPAATRKLQAAFDGLQLKPGQRLLEAGCGWGGMTRFSAQRGVKVTGITLSQRQKEYVEQKIAEEKLPAEVIYQDFFTYQPAERFDAISMMGVIEDLSDYRVVMRSLSRWLKPGGRVYLDFAAERRRFDTHSFVTQHIWPGTFRMVFMPEFVEAVRESPFELMRIDNDRRNYHLWARGMYLRWRRQRDEVVAAHGERLWRTFLLLFVAVAAMMDRPSHTATAYRVLLELPADSDGAFRTTPQVKALDLVRGAARAVREGVLKLWPGKTPRA